MKNGIEEFEEISRKQNRKTKEVENRREKSKVLKGKKFKYTL